MHLFEIDEYDDNMMNFSSGVKGVFKIPRVVRLFNIQLEGFPPMGFK